MKTWLVLLFALCISVFADTIHFKNGEKIENAKVTEITPTNIKYKIGQREVVYTIPRNDVQKIVYKDGQEDVFSIVEPAPVPVPEQEVVQQQEEVAKDSIVKHRFLFSLGYLDGFELSYVKEAIHELDENWDIRYGPGLGSLIGDYMLFPIFFNVHLGLKKDSFEYFLNNRLGVIFFGKYDYEPYGSCFFCTIFYEPSVGIKYNYFSLSLGYNFIGSDYENSLAIRIGFRFEIDAETKIEQNPETKTEPEQKAKEESSRFFRPGIELNYPVWRSSIEYFENSFPYAAIGAGLFFRIGSEFFYFTTGAYAKIESFEKHETQDLSAFGANILSLPLMDIYWNRFLFEVPLLLSFGSGQIRFTFGTLFDFYAASDFEIEVAGTGVINANDAAFINERFSENPDVDLYVVLGLDFDIVRHWGIGVKFLIWANDMGEYNAWVEPPHFQTRVSTYFVF